MGWFGHLNLALGLAEATTKDQLGMAGATYKALGGG
jgi:hypothetical protein